MVLPDAPASAADPDYALSWGCCGGLSQSGLSSLSYRSLTVTFCRKSRQIINGRLFLSISPVTGLGLCELSELCERLILSSVWAVLLHKARRRVFTPRHCASAGKQQVVLDFFEIGWSVIVRSRLFGKLTEQTE